MANFRQIWSHWTRYWNKKKAQVFLKVAQNVTSPVWLKKRWVSQLPKKSQNVLATFVIKFVAKLVTLWDINTFQQSPMFYFFPLTTAVSSLSSGQLINIHQCRVYFLWISKIIHSTKTSFDISHLAWIR